MIAPNAHPFSNWQAVRAAIRAASLALIPPHDDEAERAAARDAAARFQESAADSLRRAELLYAQAGNLDAARRARAALENL